MATARTANLKGYSFDVSVSTMVLLRTLLALPSSSPAAHACFGIPTALTTRRRPPRYLRAPQDFQLTQTHAPPLRVSSRVRSCTLPPRLFAFHRRSLVRPEAWE